MPAEAASVQVESPHVTEQEEYTDHPTEQDYTQVTASVETQSIICQNITE